MSLFVAMTEDGYALTTAGYILTAILFVAVIVIAAMLAKKGSAKKNERQTAGLLRYDYCTGNYHIYDQTV